jgi:gluconokinase
VDGEHAHDDVVLGVDIGTTSAKVLAFDAGGAQRGGGAVAYPLYEPHPGEAVQDPEDVVRGTLAAIRQAAREATAAGARVAGLSFSAAMHSLIALGDDDRALTPLITWADMRAADQANALREHHHELHARTGTPLHPMAPLAKLVWMREHEPEICERARRWVGIKELVVARLMGEWVVDHSIASGTGLFDLERLDWDAEALALAGVTPRQLSRLVPTTEILPGLAPAAGDEVGLPRGVPVVIGAGDGPLANLGVGAVHPGVAACSIGTSGALRMMVERPSVDPAGRLFCFALTPGRWVVGGAINSGGVVLQWAGEALAPDLGAHAAQALLALAAEVPAGSEGLIMLPYLLGERAPHWSSLPHGAYVGLTRAHRRGHLVRAALEGVCQQLALVLASIRDADNAVREIRATGGFARSDLWRQILTDALGMDVGFPEGHEGSSFGAALLGMEALRMIDTIDRAADHVRIADVVHPEPAVADLYARQLPTFDRLHDALVPTFRELGKLVGG